MLLIQAMTVQKRSRVLFAMMALASFVGLVSSADANDTNRVVVTVNGKAITAGDLDFSANALQIKPEDRAAREQELIRRLVDRQLIREFLQRRKVQAHPNDLQDQIQRAEEVIKRQGNDPKSFLPKIGYTPERLKSELSLPLAWQVHVRQSITTEQIRSHFDKHRQELDGTQLRARQIFLKLETNPSESSVQEKVSKLKGIREQVAGGQLSFPDAARKFSESPSAEKGGDVGRFGFGKQLPLSVIRAAFALKVNEISEPVVSSFGVHLIQVTERQPGDLSLEDVRNQIVDRLSDELWTETVERERMSAKITPAP